MKTYLKTIKGVLPFSKVDVDLKFNDKLLIVCGRTGSGKSHFLRFVHDRIETASSAKELKALPHLLSHLENIRELGKHQLPSSSEYELWQGKLHEVETQLDKLTLELSLDIAKKNTPHPLTKKGRFLRLYEASRVADILEAKSGDTLDSDIDSQYGNPFSDQSKYFERYLIAQMQQKLMAEIEEPEAAVRINLWFQNFETHLKILFGDPSTQLVYDPGKPAFYVQQKDRELFRLQNLSRGNLAFFAVYADLLVRASSLNIAAEELRGIVLIDEVDAHLDISLQRVVLPFLVEQFPKIQFIVSTNSPLVVMSVSDAVVYDLDRNKSFEQDFSLYTYEAVAEEVFRTSVGSSLRSVVNAAQM